MSYTFELTFTGLCIFTFKGDKKKPEEVNVLLVKTQNHGEHGHHQTPDDIHLPYLAYSRHDLTFNQVPGPHTLLPHADGSQTVLHSVMSEAIEIFPPDPTTPLEPAWMESGMLPQRPANSTQARWLDWVPALKKINCPTPAPAPQAPYAGLEPLSVVSRVRIRHGSIYAAGFLLELDSTEKKYDYAIWDFVFPTGDASPPPDPFPQALAGSVVVSMEGTPHERAVQIKSSRLNLSFHPPRKLGGGFEDKVKVSITNLPAQEGPPQDFLLHFAHLYDPVVWPDGRPRLRVPKKRPGVITSGNSFCPPGTYTI